MRTEEKLKGTVFRFPFIQVILTEGVPLIAYTHVLFGRRKGDRGHLSALLFLNLLAGMTVEMGFPAVMFLSILQLSGF